MTKRHLASRESSGWPPSQTSGDGQAQRRQTPESGRHCRSFATESGMPAAKSRHGVMGMKLWMSQVRIQSPVLPGALLPWRGSSAASGRRVDRLAISPSSGHARECPLHRGSDRGGAGKWTSAKYRYSRRASRRFPAVCAGLFRHAPATLTLLPDPQLTA
jgi:hypothetical protein